MPLLVRYLVSKINTLLNSCCLRYSGFCSLLDRETLLQEVMPSIEELVTDTSQHVRAALGTQISGLAPILGKEKLVERFFIQYRTSLLI